MKETKWEFEIGEQMAPRNLDAEGLMESTSNVGIVRICATSVNFLYEIREQMAPRNLDAEGLLESTSNVGIAQMYVWDLL